MTDRVSLQSWKSAVVLRSGDPLARQAAAGSEGFDHASDPER